MILQMYTDLFESQRVHVGWAVDAQGGPRECKGWGTNCLASVKNLEKKVWPCQDSGFYYSREYGSGPHRQFCF